MNLTSILKFKTFFAIGLLWSLSAFSTDKIGGKWHKEALDAWKVYSNNQQASEGSLKEFLLSNQPVEILKYHEIACTKGNANFCYLAGLFQKTTNRDSALRNFRRGCEIGGDNNNCMTAISIYLENKKMRQAVNLYKKYSVNDSVFWDYSGDFMTGYKDFREMLRIACIEKHVPSCSILKRYDGSSR